MIWALIRKDLSLLRVYLLALVGAIAVCFLGAAISIFWTAREVDELFRNYGMMVAAILAPGSLLGIFVVVIFSPLLSGSVLTLERSDRSSQFLACLPPTRLQSYLSKLIVVASTVLFSLGICLLAWFVAYRLLHQQAEAPFLTNLRSKQLDADSPLFLLKIYLGIAGAWEAVSLVYRYPFFSILVSMIGGSLIASLWAKSNAVATLCGVLPPIVIGVAIARVAMVWNIELPEQGWFNVFSIVAASFGLCCIVASGCIYRVQREF